MYIKSFCFANCGALCTTSFIILTFCLIPVSTWRGKEAQTSDFSPVILVPGDGGSQLEAKWNKPAVVQYICSKVEELWSTLWLSISDLSPYIINCMVDNMILVYNTTTKSTQNSHGVEVRVPGFGDTASVEFLDPFRPSHYISGYFDQIVATLVALGYKRNETLMGAPFDFRKAPNELDSFYSNLTKLIEDSVQNQGQKVTLIAHSMGAPVLHYFFLRKSQEWKNKYIKAVISLSGAWGGSTKTIKVYANGDNLGYWLLSASKLKRLQQSFSSLAFLMPFREVWPEDQVLVQTPTHNYTVNDLQSYIEALPSPTGAALYEQTKDLLYKAPPPGVELHCLHGVGVDTPEKLVYAKTGDFPLNPTIEYGDGDGTVNTRSAEACLKWARKQKEKIYHVPFKKVNHMQIMSNVDVLRYITDFLSVTQDSNAATRRNVSRRISFPEVIYAAIGYFSA